MEGFQISTGLPIDDIFQRESENLSSDDEFPVFIATIKENVFDCLLPKTVLVKKVSDDSVYKKLLKDQSPYVEKVFGILNCIDDLYVICENVLRPSCFDYQMYDALYNQKGASSLSLDDLIDSDHFSCFDIPRADEKHFFSEHSALTVLSEICEGLMSFSDEKLVHGDLSPQNILLTDSTGSDTALPFRPVIIDFGISKPFKEAEHMVTTIVGTKEFAAPEIMSYNKPTDRVDIYSLGCLLHFMILGKAPGENRNGLKDSEKLLSKGVYRIIKKCNADYEVRYHSLRELYKAIKNELNRGKSSLYRVISVIPGFRTHKWWKMLIAGYTYLSIISALLVNIYYRKDMDKGNWLVLLFFAVEIICVCDAFNIKRFFPKYLYWRERRPVIGHIARILIAVLITLIFIELNPLI